MALQLAGQQQAVVRRRSALLQILLVHQSVLAQRQLLRLLRERQIGILIIAPHRVRQRLCHGRLPPLSFRWVAVLLLFMQNNRFALGLQIFGG